MADTPEMNTKPLDPCPIFSYLKYSEVRNRVVEEEVLEANVRLPNAAHKSQRPHWRTQSHRRNWKSDSSSANVWCKATHSRNVWKLEIETNGRGPTPNLGNAVFFPYEVEWFFFLALLFFCCHCYSICVRHWAEWRQWWEEMWKWRGVQCCILFGYTLDRCRFELHSSETTTKHLYSIIECISHKGHMWSGPICRQMHNFFCRIRSIGSPKATTSFGRASHTHTQTHRRLVTLTFDSNRSTKFQRHLHWMAHPYVEYIRNVRTESQRSQLPMHLLGIPGVLTEPLGNET